jgi:serine/threonine-protein kinase
VLERDPDWERLPEGLPPLVRSLLARCLSKDRQLRLHHAADVRIEIDAALAEMKEPRSAPREPAPRSLARRSFWRLRWWLSGAAALLTASLAIGRDPAFAPALRLHMNLPASAPLVLERQPALAASPDGRRLVYVAARGNGTQLFVRSLDELAATPIPGTEGGASPAFSPDGERLAFAADGWLKTIGLPGGRPSTLVETPALHGVTWGTDGRIYYSPSSESGIFSIPAGGGEALPVTTPDAQQGEVAHRWPHYVAEGRALLFSVQRRDGDPPDASRIAVLSLRTGEQRVLAEGTFPIFAPSGHVLYARGGRMIASPFSVDELEVRPREVPVAEGVTVSTLSGAAQIAVSPRGPIIFAPGGPQAVARRLLWVTRNGSTRPASDAQRAYFGPRLSPDGRSVALGVEDDKGFDLWLQEVERDALMRLSADTGNERYAVWTPDGQSLLFSSARAEHPPRLVSTPADGSGESQALLDSGRLPVPGDVSPDGSVLAYTGGSTTEGTGADIWVLPLDREGVPEPFLRSDFDEASPGFSPDGRWIAFTSNETGRNEVYVRPFPGPGGKWQVSTEGGDEPRWSPLGDEIFFRSSGKMMVAAVDAGASFEAGKPSILFEDVYDAGAAGFPNYDVVGDPVRFLMIRSDTRPAPTQLNVILGWMSELERSGRVGRQRP